MLSTLAVTLVSVLPLLASAAPAKRAPSLYSIQDPNGLCLGVYGQPGNDVGLRKVPCGVPDVLTTWQIAPGENQQVQLYGTNYCLDSGINSPNGYYAKIYQCYPGAPQQNFYWTNDNHIAITGGTQCYAFSAAGGYPGLEPCGGADQSWKFYQVTTTTSVKPPTTSTTSIKPPPSSTTSVKPPPSSTTSVKPPPSSTTSVKPPPSSTTSVTTSTSTPPPPSGNGQQIHFNGDTSKCLTVTGGAQPANGSPVTLQPCFGPGDAAYLQRWEIQRGAAGAVKLAGTNFCLDAGSNPSPGNPGKVWQCYSGLSQQTYYYTQDNHVAIYQGTQCLALNADGKTTEFQNCGAAREMFTV